MSPWMFWYRIKYQGRFGVDQMSLCMFYAGPNVLQASTKCQVLCWTLGFLR